MCITKTYKTRGRRRWRGRGWECRSGEPLGKGQSCREEGESGRWSLPGALHPGAGCPENGLVGQELSHPSGLWSFGVCPGLMAKQRCLGLGAA